MDVATKKAAASRNACITSTLLRPALLLLRKLDGVLLIVMKMLLRLWSSRILPLDRVMPTRRFRPNFSRQHSRQKNY